MRKTRFKGKFMGEIFGTRELGFLGFGAFSWHKEMKSRGLHQNWHFPTTTLSMQRGLGVMFYTSCI